MRHGPPLMRSFRAGACGGPCRLDADRRGAGSEAGAYAMQGFLAVFAPPESRQADISLAARAEADAGCGDDACLVEKSVEQTPRGRAAGRFQPDVGRVDPAVDREAHRGEPFAQEAGIGHVVVDGRTHLSLSFRGIDCLGAALRDVARAVEFGALAAVPEGIERDSPSFDVGGSHFLGDDRVAAAHAGEACRLGEAAYLDGHLLRSAYLVDGVGDVRFGDIGLVGGVEDDERVVGQGVVDPSLELFVGECRAGGVVRVAEVEEVDAVVGNIGDEAVGLRGGEVGDVAPFAAVVERAGASAHDVAVDVDGIDGVGDAHAVVPPEEFADVARVALGSVADEHLRGAEADAPRLEVVFEDGFNEEVVTLFRSVSAEGPCVGHVVDGPVHGFDAGRRQWLCDVADAQGDDLLPRVGHLEGIHPLGDVGEQVVPREFQEVFVY